MPQSYKTIQRPTFLPGSRLFLLWLLFGLVVPSSAQKKPSKDSRHAEFFPHYEHRFTVPENQAEDLWKYVLEHYAPKQKESQDLEDENLTDLYFDTKAHTLRDQNLALRQRLFISGEGRKEYLQLLIPAPPDSVFGKEVRFKHNKRPDKGRAFTNHPVLKLLRSKDRPRLDSLLKPYHINATELATVLEINQDRRRLHLRHKGTDWVTLTLTRLIMQAPDHHRIQFQIQADPRTMLQATPQTRKAMVKATDELVQQFRRKFPDLKPDRRQEYIIMDALRKTPAVQKVNTKVVFAVCLLALILTLILVRYYRRKPLQPFE